MLSLGGSIDAWADPCPAPLVLYSNFRDCVGTPAASAMPMREMVCLYSPQLQAFKKCHILPSAFH